MINMVKYRPIEHRFRRDTTDSDRFRPFLPLYIDKFTKWIELKLVAEITTASAREFIRRIIYRFKVPNRIITDNGTPFTRSVLHEFSEHISIKIYYACVAHPMANSQVEWDNGMGLQSIKTRIFDQLNPYTGKWVQELPSVLWSLRTSLSRMTGQTPFFL